MFDVKLKDAMTKNNITRSQLSVISGIGKSNISQYLNGKNEPRDDVKQKLGEVLNYSFFEERIEQEDSPFIFSTKKVPLRFVARLFHISEDRLLDLISDGTIPIGYTFKVEGQERLGSYISPKLLYEVTGWREQ